ncbi:replication protein, partial [Desulfovibrio sp. OH1186_COT-070]
LHIINPVLLKAKTSFNNFTDTYYLLEYMKIEILHILRRFKAMLGYLIKYLKSESVEMHTLNKRRDNLPIISLFNR